LHPTPPESSGTLLLVEDEAALRQLMGAFLAKVGFNVLAAASGDEAIRISSQYPQPIELLVSDVVMPGMDGLELMHRLRVSRPGLIVLFVSGYDRQLLDGAAWEEGVSFLPKPFTPRTLRAKIGELMAAC
jgi:DNA-binding response OmpR family regulator